MTETLAEKKCTPCRGGIAPPTHEEAERFRSQTPNWELRDDGHRIERTFRFRNFQEALGFVRNVGDLAETEGHHPDISFGWGYATISLRTKKIKGLYEKPRAIVLSRFSAEPAFSAAALFGTFVCTTFAFGLHQGIRTAVTRYSLPMIRRFDRSRPTFTMSGQLPMRLLMHMAQ
jgi:4a-hydroxytetrahydrobiopterin dehydratase